MLGFSSTYVAELRSVFDGLRLAFEKVFQCVELQLEFEVVVKCLLGSFYGSSDVRHLVHRIRQFVLDWKVNIKHVYEEANKVADGLTNLGYSLKEANPFLFLESPLDCIKLLADADTIRVFALCVTLMQSSVGLFAPFYFKKINILSDCFTLFSRRVDSGDNK